MRTCVQVATPLAGNCPFKESCLEKARVKAKTPITSRAKAKESQKETSRARAALASSPTKPLRLQPSNLPQIASPTTTPGGVKTTPGMALGMKMHGGQQPQRGLPPTSVKKA